MMKLTVTAICLAALVACSGQDMNRASRPNIGITAQTLASSRSFEYENTIQGSIGGTWGLLNIYTTITDANDSETGVSLACTGSTDNNTTDWRIPACVWDTANTRYNCEAGPLFWNPSDETSPKRQLFRVDVEGVEDVECTFTFTGGAAADTIDAVYTLGIKG